MLNWIRRRISHLRYQLDLYRAYRAAQRFYAGYEHMARDVPYHPEMAPRLDVYSPPEGDDHPVLILVHGGSWNSLSKELFAVGGQRLTPHNVVVVIPNYTLYPEARYQQMAQEIAAVVAWTLENIGDHGGDPGRVVVSGHSAGGHLVALVAMDDRYLNALGRQRAEIRGVIGISGVYDVEAEYVFSQEGAKMPHLAGVFGGREGFVQASPVNLVGPDVPPVLLIHGDRDDVVPPRISAGFHRALLAAGASSELKVYPGAGHADFLFDLLTRERAPILDDILGFIDEHAE